MVGIIMDTMVTTMVIMDMGTTIIMATGVDRFRFGWWRPPAYAYYDDYPGDCYRVYRRGCYRVICD
jgi:hypothetical protein